MTQASAPALFRLSARQQVSSPELSMLTRIYEDEVNLAVWQRELNGPVERYAHWLLTQPEGIQWQEVINSADTATLAAQKLPPHPDRQSFIDDLVEVLDIFCCLFELDAVGMRLRVLERAMCPRFHTDRVPCRLITTYGGTGTEWLPGGAKAPLGVGASDPRLSAVQVVSSGNLALLKGDAWLNNDGFGLVHRSPQLAGGQKRLLLTADFG